jgi:hypothetical protein
MTFNMAGHHWQPQRMPCPSKKNASAAEADGVKLFFIVQSA